MAYHIQTFLAPVALVLLLSTASTIELGPHPSTLTETLFSKPEFQQVYTPIISQSDRSTCDKQLNISSLRREGGFFNIHYAQNVVLSLDWCEGLPIRVRYLELLPDKRVTVLFARKYNISSTRLYNYPLTPTCRTQRVYIEACYRPQRISRAVCVTSEVVDIEQLVIAQPRLKHRPPVILRLAPGDTAKIVTDIVNVTGETMSNPLGNGGFDRGNRRFMLRAKLRAADGRVVKQQRLKERTRTVMHIWRRDTRGRRATLLNGSLSFIEFAELKCPGGVDGTFSFRHETRIEVTDQVKSLVKQDVRNPVIQKAVFNPVRSGEDAVLEVRATNPGGGMRVGGVPTELHYQWYLKDFEDILKESYFGEIRGATNATLVLPEYKCVEPFGSGSDIAGIQQYAVDVCNTYGCQRSKIIEPRFIKDGGEFGTNYDCY